MTNTGPQTIKGVLVSGMGRGAHFTRLDWVKKQCHDKLGFIPYEGTLNVEVAPASLQASRRLRAEDGVSIIAATPGYCPARAVPVSVSGQPAAVILPDAAGCDEAIHGENILEIIAPARLKDALQIEDGDEVTISFNRSTL